MTVYAPQCPACGRPLPPGGRLSADCPGCPGRPPRRRFLTVVRVALALTLTAGVLALGHAYLAHACFAAPFALLIGAFGWLLPDALPARPAASKPPADPARRRRDRRAAARYFLFVVVGPPAGLGVFITLLSGAKLGATVFALLAVPFTGIYALIVWLGGIEGWGDPPPDPAPRPPGEPTRAAERWLWRAAHIALLAQFGAAVGMWAWGTRVAFAAVSAGAAVAAVGVLAAGSRVARRRPRPEPAPATPEPPGRPLPIADAAYRLRLLAAGAALTAVGAAVFAVAFLVPAGSPGHLGFGTVGGVVLIIGVIPLLIPAMAVVCWYGDPRWLGEAILFGLLTAVVGGAGLAVSRGVDDQRAAVAPPAEEPAAEPHPPSADGWPRYAPSPLDALDPDDIPAADRTPDLPPEAVAVLATRPPGHVGVRGLAFSPDGRTLATGGADGVVRLWDADTLRPRAALPPPALPVAPPADADDLRIRQLHTGGVRRVAFRADGRQLAAAGGTRFDPTGGWVQFWDLAADGTPTAGPTVPTGAHDAGFAGYTGEGRAAVLSTLAVGRGFVPWVRTVSGSAVLFDVETSEPVWAGDPPVPWASRRPKDADEGAPVVSPDGRRLVQQVGDRLLVWRVVTESDAGRAAREARTPWLAGAAAAAGAVVALAVLLLAGRGRRVAAAALVALPGAVVFTQPAGGPMGVAALLWASYALAAALVSSLGRQGAWGRRLRWAVLPVAVAAAGLLLASAYRGPAAWAAPPIKVAAEPWSPVTWGLLLLGGSAFAAFAGFATAGGRTPFAAWFDGYRAAWLAAAAVTLACHLGVRVYELDARPFPVPAEAALPLADAVPVGVAFTPDGRLWAVGDRELRVWDLDAGGPPAVHLNPEPTQGKERLDLSDAAATADGRFLAVLPRLGGRGGGSARWPVVCLYPLGDGGPRRIVYLPGASIADPLDGKRIDFSELNVSAFAVAPDGRSMATGHANGDLRLWDISGPEPVERTRTAVPSNDADRPPAFAPDGSRAYLPRQRYAFHPTDPKQDRWEGEDVEWHMASPSRAPPRRSRTGGKAKTLNGTSPRARPGRRIGPRGRRTQSLRRSRRTPSRGGRERSPGRPAG